MLKCDFNKVDLQLFKFTLRHGSSPVNFRIFSENLFIRTPMEGSF